MMTAARTARRQSMDVFDFMVGSIAAYVDGTMAPRLLGADGVL
jgi:hypothetical protein